MGEGECETIEISKKGRHRKKQLYNTILQQMEFYFSDSNLTKDRFLSQLITEDPYVNIEVFFKFNKIRKLNCSVDDIRKAIVGKSELIELSDDKQKICRKTPIKIKDNIDECTIYVENIKADANHEWLNQVFSDFGHVVYVSIPKYKQNKGNKGFAFVEFDSEKDAQNALDYFGSIGCKMPSETNPQDLRSIATFEDDSAQKKDNNEVVESDEKIKPVETENSKKRKLSQESQEDERQDKKLKKKNESDVKSEVKIDTSEQEDAEIKRKKKHKKDKKKIYIKELGLQILSKGEWKKMRNRYLDLQRKKMKEFKQYLHRQKFNQKNADRPKRIQEESSNITDENKPVEETLVKLQYTNGVIVKLKLPEPCVDVKKLKSEIKAVSAEVKYVDIPLPAGSEEVFVRFSSNDSAKEFCKQEFVGEKTILENEEERIYWEKIQNDRSVKFNKSVKRLRGRDKLLKKAEKERAKHIRFDEGE